MLLIYLSVAWMAGIYAAFHLQALPTSAFGLLSTLCLAVAWLWRRTPRLRLAALCALFVFLGALRYRLALPRLDERSVSAYNERGEVVLTGVVVAEPDVRDSYANLRLRAETLALEGERPVEVEGLVLVRAPRYPEHQYGDRLRVRGALKTPPVFDTFSYRDYLARQGVYSTVGWAQITTLGRNQASRLYAFLLRFKGRAHAVILDVLPEPSASLLSGILLGIEGGIPDDLLDDFHATSTSHIIAISGFNMALVGGPVLVAQRAPGRAALCGLVCQRGHCPVHAAGRWVGGRGARGGDEPRRRVGAALWAAELGAQRAVCHGPVDDRLEPEYALGPGVFAFLFGDSGFALVFDAFAASF